MILKTLFSMITLVCLANLHAQPTLYPFELKGSIQGIDSGKIVLGYFNYFEFLYDTVEIEHSEFQFRGKLPEPALASIATVDGSYGRSIYISPAKMNIKLFPVNPDTMEFNGSVMQEDADEFDDQIHEVKSRIMELVTLNRDLRESLKNGSDSTLSNDVHRSLDSVDHLLHMYERKKLATSLHYIKTNPGSYYALFLLSMYAGNEDIPVDTAITIIGLMDTTVLASNLGRLLTKKLSILRSNQPGNMAFKFKTTDIRDQPFDLANLDGHVILLDFWASWCVPCRASTPFLRSLYQQYHTNGFDIVSISSDDKKDDWKKAVEDDNMSWLQVSVPSPMVITPATRHDILDHYYSGSIPVYILVDRSGKIVGRWMGWDDKNKGALAEAMEQQFESSK